MTSFEPAPWPVAIRNRFVPGPVPTEVPEFLHSLILDYTETLASIDPDFRYREIRVKFDGSALVYLKDEEKYDERMQDALEYMMKELTNAYIIAARQ